MTVLEKAVLDLANALDQLEAQIEGKFDEKATSTEEIDAARRQAREAREHAENAAAGVGAAISDLKNLLSDTAPGGKG